MNNKFQNGDRVRIISKSVGCTLEDSNIYKTGGGIGYVINNNRFYTFTDKCVMVHSKKEETVGDFFAPEDLELYDNPTKMIDDLFDDMIGAL